MEHDNIFLEKILNKSIIIILTWVSIIISHRSQTLILHHIVHKYLFNLI